LGHVRTIWWKAALSPSKIRIGGTQLNGILKSYKVCMHTTDIYQKTKLKGREYVLKVTMQYIESLCMYLNMWGLFSQYLYFLEICFLEYVEMCIWILTLGEYLWKFNNYYVTAQLVHNYHGTNTNQNNSKPSKYKKTFLSKCKNMFIPYKGIINV
jgi:hypothetical protein